MTGMGDEFSLVPQWLKSSHGLQSPGAGSHSAGELWCGLVCSSARCYGSGCQGILSCLLLCNRRATAVDTEYGLSMVCMTVLIAVSNWKHALLAPHCQPAELCIARSALDQTAHKRRLHDHTCTLRTP